MATVETVQLTARGRRTDNLILFRIAAAIAVAHLLTNQRYGFHRDELQFLSDARHLEWGFVAYPPLTPFFEDSARSLWCLPGRSATFLGDRTVSGGGCERVDGAGAGRGSAGTGYSGAVRRAFTFAVVQRHRISVHQLRFPVVGADCILGDPAAEIRKPKMVAGCRGAERPWPDDEICHRLLPGRTAGRLSSDTGAALFRQLVFSGRLGDRACHFLFPTSFGWYTTTSSRTTSCTPFMSAMWARDARRAF